MFQSYYSFRKNSLINLFVINLRYLIGLGFLPSGMVKILDRPFTNPDNTGSFAEFLHAFYDTGFFYNTVGILQVLAAVLLITQRFATLGAFLFLPLIFSIAILTLSTIGSLTPIIACAMLLGIIFLLYWDYFKWKNILNKDNQLDSTIEMGKIPTYNSVFLFTGVAFLTIPSAFIYFELPVIAIASLLLIVSAGNILSELKQPVLRKRKYSSQ